MTFPSGGSRPYSKRVGVGRSGDVRARIRGDGVAYLACPQLFEQEISGETWLGNARATLPCRFDKEDNLRLASSNEAVRKIDDLGRRSVFKQGEGELKNSSCEFRIDVGQLGSSSDRQDNLCDPLLSFEA
jgi:hypothetical protein